MGGPGSPGAVVRADRVLPPREREGVAEYLTVVSSERHRSYDDDGECWLTSWAWVCREADPEEGAEVRAAYAWEQAAKVTKRRALDLWASFRAALAEVESDTPAGQVRYPAGDDGVEAYAGGFWGRQDAAVLDEVGGWVWYLVYNGRDGDDWGRNNCEGHSIARRYRLTPELRDAYHRAAEAQRAAKALGK
jgi:hypothetical protein